MSTDAYASRYYPSLVKSAWVPLSSYGSVAVEWYNPTDLSTEQASYVSGVKGESVFIVFGGSINKH